MQKVEEVEIEIAVERMILSINDVLQRTKNAAEKAQTPALFDLRAACLFKGATSFDTVRKYYYLQPLCGFCTHWEDTPKRRKPRWTRGQVATWATVTKPQRVDYILNLLYGANREISAGALHMIIKDSEAGRLPEYIQEIVDEYVKKREEEILGTYRITGRAV